MKFLSGRSVWYRAEDVFKNPVISMSRQFDTRARVDGLTLLEGFLAMSSRLKADHLPKTGIGVLQSPIGPTRTFLSPALHRFHWSPKVTYPWTIEASLV